MWTGFFVITTIICGLGWISNHIAEKAMANYIKKNQYKLPDEKELKECIDYTVRNLFK